MNGTNRIVVRGNGEGLKAFNETRDNIKTPKY